MESKFTKAIVMTLVVLQSLTLGAANYNIQDDIETLRKSEISNIPAYIKFKRGKEPLLKNLNNWLLETYHLNAKFNLVLISQDADQLGYIHYRYQQTYNGIAIEESRIVVHTQQGYIYSLNSVAFDNIRSAADNSSISESDALAAALQHVKAEKYMWQSAGDELRLKKSKGNELATYYPKGELVYVLNREKLHKKILNLAYKFDIYAKKPLYRAYVYIDATTATIVAEKNRIHHVDAVGTATTSYSGIQAITADFHGGNYRLRETARGNGIETYNLQQGTDYFLATDFTDGNNLWYNVNVQQDQYATDAHWGTEKTYDFYWTKFNRNSIDNNGYKIESYVHYDYNYYNAFWDGSVMTYGDGGGTSGATPLVSVDIVGHEITHGLTEHTAGLEYFSESGGLNESFSDIFGQSIEFYAKPATANWLLGNEIGASFRSMSNPNTYNDPDTYHGLNWDPDEEVHNISGVQNFWFYLLSMGGTGTNDNGNAYSVTGIGIDNAAKIAYRNLTVYLTPTSNYADARYYAIQSAVDLFGACSPEVIATTNAWHAVGIGTAFVTGVQSNFTANVTSACSVPTTINFTNSSNNGSSYLWYFGDGTTSTQINPSHVYANFGNYSVKLVTYGGACGKDSIIKTSYININPSNNCPVILASLGSTATQTACTGILYDDGGASSNYSPFSSGKVTIAPVGATQITLTFSSFDFETDYDYLKIYAGPSISSPLVGAYSGSSLPGGGILVINSGVVTIQQTSDITLEKSGFALNWQCSNSVVSGIFEQEQMDRTLSLFPNPAHDAVTVMYSSISENPINVLLTDAVGKQLKSFLVEKDIHKEYSQKIELSHLPNGIYFVTVKDGEKSVVKKLIVIK